MNNTELRRLASHLPATPSGTAEFLGGVRWWLASGWNLPADKFAEALGLHLFGYRGVRYNGGPGFDLVGHRELLEVKTCRSDRTLYYEKTAVGKTRWLREFFLRRAECEPLRVGNLVIHEIDGICFQVGLPGVAAFPRSGLDRYPQPPEAAAATTAGFALRLAAASRSFVSLPAFRLAGLPEPIPGESWVGRLTRLDHGTLSGVAAWVEAFWAALQSDTPSRTAVRDLMRRQSEWQSLAELEANPDYQNKLALARGQGLYEAYRSDMGMTHASALDKSAARIVCGGY